MVYLFVGLKAHFNPKVSTNAEREKRRSLFVATHTFIQAHNQKNGTYKMDHNRFSSMVSFLCFPLVAMLNLYILI